MTFRPLLIAASAAALIACSGVDEDVVDATDTVATDTAAAVDTASDDMAEAAGLSSGTEYSRTDSAAALKAALDAQPDEAKARYQYRNPGETLAFFGIEPGMAVGEALPGGGWYSKILLPYLGDDGRLVGVDYDITLWPNFGFATDEFIETKKTWAEDWVADASGWTDSDVDIDAYTFATLPQDGSLDAFLFIRALHNLSRFEGEGQFLTNGLAAVHGALKPGGIVGVVQHAAPEGNSDASADGNNGYLKASNVIKAFEAAGFELVERSDINANPADVPGEEDGVWRLPPSLATSRDNPELREQMQSIGESNRMTLLFRKV